jgi:hypothetical protein
MTKFQAAAVDLSTSQPCPQNPHIYCDLLLGFPNGHFPNDSFTKINERYTDSDLDINHDSDAINLYSS